MPTISDLVKHHSKVPGDIRIRKLIWPNPSDWFQPFFPCKIPGLDPYFHGLNDYGAPSKYPSDEVGWQLYAEPKPNHIAQKLIELEAVIDVMSPEELAEAYRRCSAKLQEPKPKVSLDRLTRDFCDAVQSHFANDRTVKIVEPKVMRAQYILDNKRSGYRPFTTDEWFIDEEDLRKKHIALNCECTITRLQEREFER